MIRMLVLYESKGEFTEKTAKALALILGPAKCCKISGFDEKDNEFEAVTFCIDSNSKKSNKSTYECISQNADWISKKKVFLVYIGSKMSKKDKAIKDALGDSIKFQTVIDPDSFNNKKLTKLALNIKQIKDIGKNTLEEEKLKEYIDDFIKNHNTCTLITGHNSLVRGTPIEYMFINECFYIISEGGEKFLHILINPNVSICIYDSYESMGKLAGMQITGCAEIIELGSEKYISVMSQKGLSDDKLKAIPINLNLIKININTVEFLWSGFAKMGYDTKQILHRNFI